MKKPSPYQKAAAKSKRIRANTKAAVKRAVKRIPRKVRAIRQAIAVALTPEERAKLVKESEDALWSMLPIGIGSLRKALTAKRDIIRSGQVLATVDDHFIQLQAMDRLLKATLLYEDRETRQQVIIYNAITGAFADRLRDAGWTGAQIVPMPEIPK